MSTSEEMPTLASLRRKPASRTAKRAPKPLASPGLFDALPAEQVAEAPKPRQAPAPVAPRPEPEALRIWSVAALVQSVRSLVERSFTQVSVEGEISNWRPAASGHCYFTLKDGDAQLSIVMFRRQAQLLRFKPKDGDAVRLRGQLSIYESRGQMQLIAETMEQVGMGALLAAVRELKERLRREGLFDRQRPLPEFPRCIGIVTSAQGAALRDIVKVCRRRHAAVRLLVYPAAVQGPNCAAEVAAGVNWFSQHSDQADVVLVARGGGSWEDLHGFDAEIIARAIAACSVPVITGIGHAVDTTIADAAADVCAPTPSAAAEIVTAAHFGVAERVERLHSRLRRVGRYELLAARQKLQRLSAEMVLRRVRDGLSRREQRLDELSYRAETALLRRTRQRKEQLTQLDARLRQQHVALRVSGDTRRLQSLQARLLAARATTITRGEQRLQRAATKLEALSPLRVLERGYALVYTERNGAKGQLLRSADEVHEGEAIVAQLANGRLRATITETNK
jgi:exodeoxyribonuclease VII large subunit